MYAQNKGDQLKKNIYFTCNPDRDQNKIKSTRARNINCRKMTNFPKGKDQGILWSIKNNSPYKWPHAFKGEVIYPNLSMLNYIAEYNDKYDDSTGNHNLAAMEDLTIEDNNEHIHKPPLYLGRICHSENEIIKDRNMKKVKCVKGIFKEEND